MRASISGGIPVPDVVRDTSDREASATYVSVGNESIVFSVGAEEASWLEVYDRDGYAATGDATAVLHGVGPLTYGTIAPDDSSIVALTGPEFAPARSVWHLTFDGATAEWELPQAESFAGGLDFDGRWVMAPLDSGRVFVVDTESVAARVVDVYAEVWFD